jgi:hypothetical protein
MRRDGRGRDGRRHRRSSRILLWGCDGGEGGRRCQHRWRSRWSGRRIGRRGGGSLVAMSERAGSGRVHRRRATVQLSRPVRLRQRMYLPRWAVVLCPCPVPGSRLSRCRPRHRRAMRLRRLLQLRPTRDRWLDGRRHLLVRCHVELQQYRVRPRSSQPVSHLAALGAQPHAGVPRVVARLLHLPTRRRRVRRGHLQLLGGRRVAVHGSRLLESVHLSMHLGVRGLQLSFDPGGRFGTTLRGSGIGHAPTYPYRTTSVRARVDHPPEQVSLAPPATRLPGPATYAVTCPMA